MYSVCVCVWIRNMHTTFTLFKKDQFVTDDNQSMFATSLVT